MKKVYERPSCTDLDSLCFETVCAASGAFACPFAKSAPNPLEWTDNNCPSCLSANVSGYLAYKEQYARDHYGDALWESHAADAYIKSNGCPAGLSY